MIDQKTLKTFDKLYSDTYLEVSKYVVAHCSDIEDVKDILQEIYLSVYKNLSKIKEHDKAYVMGIAKNKVQDYYRFSYKAKFISLFSKKEDIELIDMIPSEDDFEKSRQLQYDIEPVWEYLKKKPAIISKIFYFYYYMEMTIKEIAGELDITESNVKNYLYRTLKELKPYLERESDENV